MEPDQLDERIRRMAPANDGVTRCGVVIDRDHMRFLVTEMDRMQAENEMFTRDREEWDPERTILLRHIKQLSK